MHRVVSVPNALGAQASRAQIKSTNDENAGVRAALGTRRSAFTELSAAANAAAAQARYATRGASGALRVPSIASGAVADDLLARPFERLSMDMPSAGAAALDVPQRPAYAEHAVRDIDSGDLDNELMVIEYVEEITAHLLEKEAACLPDADYMTLRQHDVDASMRARVVDWLVDVHIKMHMCTETLHTAVQYLDRYLAAVPVARSRLQLVGITALFLASKYEDMYAPSVRDCVALTSRAYTTEEILSLEREMLRVFNFNLTVPTAYPFIKRFAKAGACDARTERVVHMFCEMALHDVALLQYRPSQVAAASVYLACLMCYAHFSWDTTMHFYTYYTEDAIIDCARDLLALRARLLAPTSSNRAMFKKFTSQKYLCVANIEPSFAL